MKHTSLFLTIFSAAFILLLSACAAGGPSLAGTSWKLVSYGSKTAQTAATAGVDTNLTFGADGKLGGNLGCNSMGGEYTLSGQKLTFINIYATEMACQEPQMTQESTAFQILQGETTFKVDGDVLTITSTDGNRVLTFTAIKTK